MRSARFERATFASGGRRSIQLSYERFGEWEANKPSSVSVSPDPAGRRGGGGSFLWDGCYQPPRAAYPGLSDLSIVWRGPRLAPYLALLLVGFPVPSLLPADAVVSYTTVSPLPVPLRVIGGLFSVVLSVALRRPAVSRHPALRSSDFPRPPDPRWDLTLAIRTRFPSCQTTFVGFADGRWALGPPQCVLRRLANDVRICRSIEIYWF